MPAWISYMQTALQQVPPDPLTMPDNIVTVKIDPDTGLRAVAGQPDAVFEIFRKGNEPRELATSTGAIGRGKTAPSVEELF